ncbi:MULTISPECIES: HTTM domain-containing protein [Haloarcula]|uniref:HTTM domain-containing protein n=1 Tax=Haloarcula TaxID=2237 RepID=UPI0023EB7759|nr:HTTM domain-containing protein [Halomicroarcula sp. XH51]
MARRAGTAWLCRALASRFAVDTRALAVFRVALATLLLVDLARRATDLVAFYTDHGVFPRALLPVVEPGYQYLSLHVLSGAAWVQWTLFAVAALAAVSLLVGYRTRLALLVSLVLLVSIQARNPAILNSGDTLFRRLLFWSLFLPLGERWAVDATGEDWRPAVVGPATAGLLLQVVAVYATNAVVKFRADVWLRGDAVRYAFQLDHFTVLLGDVLAGHATLLTLADWGWVTLLVASPLLVALTGYPRAALAAAFAPVHLGMVLTLSLGIFPLVSVTALVPFVPPVVWDRLQRRGPTGLGALAGTLPDRRDSFQVPGGVRSLARAAAVVCLVALLAVNAVGLGLVAPPAGTPDAVADRSWDMFAPSPPLGTWWYAAPATLASGQRVDALRRGPVDLSRPPDAAGTYPNERWRKFLDDARREPALQRSLVAHLCWRWNRAHEDEMVAVRLVQLREPTDLDGPETVEREQFAAFECADVS